jgi:hypothetical protein
MSDTPQLRLKEDDEPEILTTKGMMRISLLRRVDGEKDDDIEHTIWVEYYLEDELVHRSVHVTLKKSPEIGAEIGKF